MYRDQLGILHSIRHFANNQRVSGLQKDCVIYLDNKQFVYRTSRLSVRDQFAYSHSLNFSYCKRSFVIRSFSTYSKIES